jgi:hypothetical protein
VSHDRPILLVHGDDDDVVPVVHLERLLRAAAGSERNVESLVIHGGHHSWLYEFEEYRRAVAFFLATALGGPYSPAEAADRAAAVAAERVPAGEAPFEAIEAEPGGFRTLAGVAMPGGSLRRRRSTAATVGSGLTEGPPAELPTELPVDLSVEPAS